MHSKFLFILSNTTKFNFKLFWKCHQVKQIHHFKVKYEKVVFINVFSCCCCWGCCWGCWGCCYCCWCCCWYCCMLVLLLLLLVLSCCCSCCCKAVVVRSNGSNVEKIIYIIAKKILINDYFERRWHKILKEEILKRKLNYFQNFKTLRATTGANPIREILSWNTLN